MPTAPGNPGRRRGEWVLALGCEVTRPRREAVAELGTPSRLREGSFSHSACCPPDIQLAFIFAYLYCEGPISLGTAMEL